MQGLKAAAVGCCAIQAMRIRDSGDVSKCQLLVAGCWIAVAVIVWLAAPFSSILEGQFLYNTIIHLA